jgi:hypothetical protein
MLDVIFIVKLCPGDRKGAGSLNEAAHERTDRFDTLANRPRETENAR